MHLEEFRTKSLGELGFDQGRCLVEVTEVLQLRWPVKKRTLISRGLYDHEAKVAVEKVLRAYGATTKPAPVQEFGCRCLDVLLEVPSSLSRLTPRGTAVVRIGRHVKTAEPLLITAYATDVVGLQTSEIFLEIAETLEKADLVSLAFRMAQLDAINRRVLT